MPTKIYRGGVDKTTPVTHEAKLAAGLTAVKPGTLVTLTAAGQWAYAASTDVVGKVLYVIGIQLGGGIEDVLSAADGDTIRAYELRANHLYAVRAEAALSLVNDTELGIFVGGRVGALTGDDHSRLFVDTPSSATLGAALPATTEGQLIPVKFI